MAKIHQRNFTVRWAELDSNGRFGPEHFLRYLIETAYDWGDSLGLGHQAYAELGIYWLIRETELIVEKFPQHNDQLTLSIWMDHWQRVRGLRNFRITRAGSDEVFAYGGQKVVVMDVNTQRPTKLGEEVISRFLLEKPEPVPSLDKLHSPSAATPFARAKRVVNWSDLDAQRHVNNVVYVNYARDMVNEVLSVTDPELVSGASKYIHVEYSSPAVWREKLVFDFFENGEDHALRYFRVSTKREDDSLVMECVLGVER